MDNYKIVFIGAGNLATQLASRCKKLGYNIAQIYSKTEESAKTLASICKAPYTTDLSSIISNADIYIYAVKDTALEATIQNTKTKKGIHIHTAGSMPLSIFKNNKDNFGAFYPFQTFSKNREVDFSKIPILIEANTEDNTVFLEEFGRNLSQQVLRCSSDQRKSVHLSGVFACNFVNHMYSIAEGLLQDANLPFEVLQTLIDETAAKTHTLSPKKAQTGPAVRYDTNVINKHLIMLNDNPNEKELYELISKNIHRTKNEK